MQVEGDVMTTRDETFLFTLKCSIAAMITQLVEATTTSGGGGGGARTAVAGEGTVRSLNIFFAIIVFF